MSEPNDIPKDYADAVDIYERDALRAENARLRAVIRDLVEWQQDELTTKIWLDEKGDRVWAAARKAISE